MNVEYETFPNGAILSSTANAGLIYETERAKPILKICFLKFS
jgi:hypothetical protein